VSLSSHVMRFERFRRVNGLPEFRRQDPAQLVAVQADRLFWPNVQPEVRRHAYERPFPSAAAEVCWMWAGQVGHVGALVFIGPSRLALPAVLLAWRLLRPDEPPRWLERRCPTRICANPFHYELGASRRSIEKG